MRVKSASRWSHRTTSGNLGQVPRRWGRRVRASSADRSLHEPALLVRREIGPRVLPALSTSRPSRSQSSNCRWALSLPAPPDEGRIKQEIDLGPRSSELAHALAHGAIQHPVGRVEFALWRPGPGACRRSARPRARTRRAPGGDALRPGLEQFVPGRSSWPRRPRPPWRANRRRTAAVSPLELADLQVSQADVAGRIVRILAIAGFAGIKRDGLPRRRTGRVPSSTPAPMHAVAADPAFRRSAGRDQPQPLPRPGQRHGTIDRIEVAQPSLLPRTAEAEGQFRLGLRGRIRCRPAARLWRRARRCRFRGSPRRLAAMTSNRPGPAAATLAIAISVVFSTASSTQPSLQLLETGRPWARPPSKVAAAVACRPARRDGRARFLPAPARCGTGPGPAASRRTALRCRGPSPGLPGERSSSARRPWSPRRPRPGSGSDTRRGGSRTPRRSSVATSAARPKRISCFVSGFAGLLRDAVGGTCGTAKIAKRHAPRPRRGSADGCSRPGPRARRSRASNRGRETAPSAAPFHGRPDKCGFLCPMPSSIRWASARGRKLPAGRTWKHVSSNVGSGSLIRSAVRSARGRSAARGKTDDDLTAKDILIVFGAAGCAG